jgi:hypothetical protein
VYDTLEFESGVVYSRRVMNVDFDHPQNNQDSDFSRMGRVTIQVDHHNEQPAPDPVTSSGSDTEVRLELTEKGYKYVNNN